MLEVFDLGLEFLLLGFLEPRFELGQVGDEVGRLVVTDLLEQRFYPRVGLRGASPIEVVRHRPEMFFGVPEVQLLPGIGETVFDQVPNPHGAVGDDQHLLGLG